MTYFPGEASAPPYDPNYFSRPEDEGQYYPQPETAEAITARFNEYLSDQTIPQNLVDLHERVEPLVNPEPSNVTDFALSALSVVADLFSTVAPLFFPRRPLVQINVGNPGTHPHNSRRLRHEDSDDMTTGEAIGAGGVGAAGALTGAHLAGRFQSQLEEAQEGLDALVQTNQLNPIAQTFKDNLISIYSNFVVASQAKRNLTFAGIVTTAGLVIGAAKKSWKVTKISGIATLALMGVGLYCSRPRGIFDAAGRSRQAHEANERILEQSGQ